MELFAQIVISFISKSRQDTCETRYNNNLLNLIILINLFIPVQNYNIFTKPWKEADSTNKSVNKSRPSRQYRSSVRKTARKSNSRHRFFKHFLSISSLKIQHLNSGRSENRKDISEKENETKKKRSQLTKWNVETERTRKHERTSPSVVCFEIKYVAWTIQL